MSRPEHVRDANQNELDTVVWLTACEQIRQLASRYAVRMGRRDFDGLAQLFVPEVRVGSNQGRAVLARDFERQLDAIPKAILHVTNHVIDVQTSDKASGIVSTRAELEWQGKWITQMIEYEDDYRVNDGKWLFIRRKHRLWYGAPIGTSPLGLPDANWPDSAVGMGDLGQ